MLMGNGVEEQLKHFDTGYNSEIIDFATNVALKDSKYIFVKNIKKQQYGYCTHCNTEFPTHLPKVLKTEYEMCGCSLAFHGDFNHKKQGEKMECPNCGSICYIRYAGLSRNKLIDKSYFVYYEKSKLDPNILVARGIFAARNYKEDYKNIKTELVTEVYYIFQYKKLGKMIKPITESWNKVHLGFSKTVHSWSDRHPFIYTCYSRDSIEEAVKDTPFSWSGWQNYNYKEMTEYFDLFSRYPVFEYLNKLGHKEIIEEKLTKKGISGGVINWKGKSIESIFKISKNDYYLLKNKNIVIDSRFLNALRINEKMDLGLSILEVAELSKYMCYEGEIEGFKNTFKKYLNFKQAFKYCLKQMKKSDRINLNWVVRDWQDYISECKKLKMDLKRENIRFPNNLQEAHQKTTVQIQYAENKELNKLIQKRLPKLQKYCFSYEGIFIRPANSSFELVEEGKELQHCVGRYAKKYAEGTTIILLIRKESEPDKPFFTMEIDGTKIIQTRGLDNCGPDEDVKTFIDAFTAKKLTDKKVKNRLKISA